MQTTVHPFERAGLGKAPFRFVGVQRVVYQACPGAPVQPGGSCDYCGTGIAYHCFVEDANGRSFKVGCDCIAKVYQAGSPLLTAAERAVKLATKRAKDESERARIEAAKQALAADPSLFADVPHSLKWQADRGKTQRDEIEWLFRHAGRAGMMRATKAIERAGA